MEDTRIQWDDLWMSTAKLVGRRSACSRMQYGAVIVSSDNRVLSVGYNGAPAGSNNEGQCVNWCERAKTVTKHGYEAADKNYLDCPAVHAELNAILRAPNLWLEQSPVLYVNGVTCLRCALTIANSGIKTVVFLLNDNEVKRSPEKTRDLLRDYGINVRFKEEYVAG